MMCAKWLTALGMLFAGSVSVSVMAQGGAPAVLQRGYDPNVSGATLAETALNTASVGPASFGRLFKLPLDGNAYAQPLYVPNVAIPGLGTHNVLYVATMNDSIYAFDADAGGAPLLDGESRQLPLPPSPWCGRTSIFRPSATAGNLGILSTPVIDPGRPTSCTWLPARSNRARWRTDCTPSTSPTARNPMVPAC